MIPPSLPHKQFVRFVRNKANRYGSLRTDHRHFQVWYKLKATSLDAAYRQHLLRLPRPLLQRPRQPRTTQHRPYRRRDQRDKADQHKNKNDLRPHQDIVNRLADRILARLFQPTPLAAVLEGHGNFSALPIWEQTLQPLFYACADGPSSASASSICLICSSLSTLSGRSSFKTGKVSRDVSSAISVAPQVLPRTKP